jgi:hypothetical protein
MKTTTMEQGKYIGILCGIGGGLTNFFIKMNDAPFVTKFIEAGLTAFVCGLLGAAGKHLYDKVFKKQKNG